MRERELVPVENLSGLDADELAQALKPVFEDAYPLVPVLQGRRFAAWEDVVAVVEDHLTGGGEAERVAVLRAHPRLGAPPDELARQSRISWAEQGGAERRAGTDIDARLAELNDAYEHRFGFPFVEFVDGRPLATIVPILEERLTHDRATEVEAGCASFVAIARSRLQRLNTRAGSPQEQTCR